MKTKATKTKDQPEVRIRACPGRSGFYHPGAYYSRTSTIGLRLEKNTIEKKNMTDDQIEGKILNVLLHEVNHWATFLFLDRLGWVQVSHAMGYRKHSERMVERIAEWPLEGRF